MVLMTHWPISHKLIHSLLMTHHEMQVDETPLVTLLDQASYHGKIEDYIGLKVTLLNIATSKYLNLEHELPGGIDIIALSGAPAPLLLLQGAEKNSVMFKSAQCEKYFGRSSVVVPKQPLSFREGEKLQGIISFDITLLQDGLVRIASRYGKVEKFLSTIPSLRFCSHSGNKVESLWRIELAETPAKVLGGPGIHDLAIQHQQILISANNSNIF